MSFEHFTCQENRLCSSSILSFIEIRWLQLLQPLLSCPRKEGHRWKPHRWKPQSLFQTSTHSYKSLEEFFLCLLILTPLFSCWNCWTPLFLRWMTLFVRTIRSRFIARDIAFPNQTKLGFTFYWIRKEWLLWRETIRYSICFQ